MPPTLRLCPHRLYVSNSPAASCVLGRPYVFEGLSTEAGKWLSARFPDHYLSLGWRQDNAQWRVTNTRSAVITQQERQRRNVTTNFVRIRNILLNLKRTNSLTIVIGELIPLFPFLLHLRHLHHNRYYYYYYYYYRISHFSALAGKYSPILGCNNQQD